MKRILLPLVLALLAAPMAQADHRHRDDKDLIIIYLDHPHRHHHRWWHRHHHLHRRDICIVPWRYRPWHEDIYIHVDID